MRARATGATLVLCLTAGCSGGMLVDPGPFPVDGQWAVTGTVPGTAFGFTLVSSGSTVTGTGSFRGEAGPAGTMTITGTLNGSDVRLDFLEHTTVPQDLGITEEHFAGTVGRTEMNGTIKRGPPADPSPPVQTTFTRITG